MQSSNFKQFTMRMTPKNKLLAAFVVIFVLIIALAMLAVAAVGGAIVAVGSGIVGGFRRLFNPNAARIEGAKRNEVIAKQYDGLDPSKRIDHPQD
jgi:hypothetical protein